MRTQKEAEGGKPEKEPAPPHLGLGLAASALQENQLLCSKPRGVWPLLRQLEPTTPSPCGEAVNPVALCVLGLDSPQTLDGRSLVFNFLPQRVG